MMEAPSCGGVVEALRSGRIDDADRLSRECARRVWEEKVSRWDRGSVIRFIDAATGGLGYTSDDPLNPLLMTMAGAVIAWPEAVRDGSVVVEIGTGIGRTCYAVHYSAKPSLYLTIDVSAEMLAIALYSNPVPEYRDCLNQEHVKIVLADAAQVLSILPSGFADHVIHDGGPNPLRNPHLYSQRVFNDIFRVLRPCGTVSVFAGRSRRGRQQVYRALVQAGFTDIGSTSLPESPAQVYRARKPCR